MVGRVSSPQFVGRREELKTLQWTLDQARAGAGSVALVGGEAGIGKSRLIGELRTAARGSGATVLIGECLPLGEGELPYAPIVGALRSLVRQYGADGVQGLASSGDDELVRLLPELCPSEAGASRPGSAGAQARLFEQLLAVFVAAARDAPIVLVIEDLHWSDRSTRDFLAFLVRGARRERVALVVSYRSDELQRQHPARPFLLELERSGQAVRVELSPFTRTEIREQVKAILGSEPERGLIDRLRRRAEGNPFFTEELLVSTRAASEVLPDSVRDGLLIRVERCTDDTQAVLQIASVAGRSVDHERLETVAELPPDRLRGALREAIDSHVLVVDTVSASYSFRHALLREAVYGNLLPGERQTLHLRFANVLQQRPELARPDAETSAELAHHWYAARELAPALTASVAAGIAAENVYASGEALVNYERALEIWDAVRTPAPEVLLGRLDVMRRAAEAANLTGASERAIALARETLERVGPLPPEESLARERLGRYLWTAGRGEDALPQFRLAVELMPASPPSAERAYVLAAEAQALMLCGRNQEAQPECLEALEIARLVGARQVEANVLNTLIANFGVDGDTESAVKATAQALKIARELGLAEEIGRSYVNGSDALEQAGRMQEAIAMATEGIDVCARYGNALVGDFLRGEVIGRLLRTGAWSEAEALLDEVLDRTLPGTNAGIAYGHLGWLHAQRGAFAAASLALARAEENVARAGGSMWFGPIGEAQAGNALWAGDPKTAAEIVDRRLGQVSDSEWVFFTARLYELGARACADLALQTPQDRQARAREAARAEALLERLDRVIARLPGSTQPRVAASRQTCAAERSRIDAGHDEAPWKAAHRLWQECGDPYEAAYAGRRCAEAVIAKGGDRREAERLASEAHGVATKLGARPLTEQLEALARRARLDLGERPHEPAANALLEALDLTPRETEVLTLLADGMTNREIAAELFISDKTASVHVSRILSKLSVPNRAAAAAAAQHLAIRHTPTRAPTAK